MAGETFPNTYFPPAYFPSGHFGAQQTQSPPPATTAAGGGLDRGYATGYALRRRKRRVEVNPIQIVAAVLAMQQQRQRAYVKRANRA